MDIGLIQDGNRRDGKKLVDSEYILKVEAQKCFEKSDMKCVREKKLWISQKSLA